MGKIVDARRSTWPAGRWLVGASAALALALPMSSPAVADSPAQAPSLTLVTLHGGGTAASAARPDAESDPRNLLAEQDALLAEVGSEAPVYRWTTALNGFAAALTSDQATALARDPRVALVEANEVRPLAAHARSQPSLTPPQSPRLRGGAGVVIGVVDSGIAPESPAFAAIPGLGRDPESFGGTCAEGEGWPADTCNRKLVGARWYVAGFGAARVRASESLSPVDSLGHGTQVASVAAGNAGVSVLIDDRDAGQFGGTAPQSRIAVYKACWGAPDPDDDGCATADVVTAIDQAVEDGVDVLNLAVAGGSGLDTVQHALLGAAEADVVAIGAAGNTRSDSYAAHSGPWVTSVGATVGNVARGSLRLLGGPTLVGGGRPTVVTGRAVLGADARAEAASVRDARQCRPGSLDARVVAGRVVVCERGGIARIDKADAVDQADGTAMVLINVRPGGLTADLHAVPSVHLSVREGRVLRRWIRTHSRPHVRMLPSPDARDARRTAPWSAVGDPRGPTIKPDLVAQGDSVLGATPASTGSSWGVFSGSSAASARTAGAAALLRSTHDWSAAVIRSVLAGSATSVPSRSVFSQGAGALTRDVGDTHLALDVAPSAWRRALRTGSFLSLNTTSVLLPSGRRGATRRVTNVGSRAEYFSVTVRGFTSRRVSVRPLALRLAPGESGTFRIRVGGASSAVSNDDGEVVWLGARGGTTRIPVALTR